jgi:sigma-B regulation protein RsbU (phosphoserine phosphatase)
MWDTRSPRELCRRLNRILCEITPLGKFVSFFYGVLDSKDNRLTYCNAGHNPPVLVRANGVASELNAAGAVLGQFPDWVYEQSDVQLQSGDTLMLFTDGVVEACDREDEAFGEERVIGIARENRSAGAEELKTLLMRAASEHCGGHFQDDASMIVLRAV